MYAQSAGRACENLARLPAARASPYIARMKNLRQGGGFGFVVLLVVVAVVLLLASRMVRGLGSAAADVTKPEREAAISADVAPPADVNSGAGQRQIQARAADARRQTSAHTDEVKKALENSQ